MAHRVDPSCLGDLQFQQEKIRNFCILAHVDHGKTTLSDSLVSSNGIISNKLAGKLRFLDSTLEEQTRGITMHSSAISLLYELEDKTDTTAIGSNGKVDRYLINLIDSPGHIDFAGDVSTATRLCDGALIVVDVLEGVCTQTHAVLYKALRERMKPCLVLNKLDRLAMELRLSPVEAFYHLRRLLENINAVVYSLLNSELIRRAEEEAEFINAGKPEVPKNTPDSGAYDHSDSELFNEWNFSPENGNVIFTAAVDCWGFSLMKFVNIWSKKLGLNKAVLKKYFFEDYSFNSTTKKIVSCDPADATAKPMFATMVLDPIWQLYDVALGQQDPVKASKMAQRAVSSQLLLIVCLSYCTERAFLV